MIISPKFLFPQCQTSEGIGVQQFCKLSHSRLTLLQAEFTPAAGLQQQWPGFVVISGNIELEQIIGMHSPITCSFSLKPAWHPALSISHTGSMCWFL